MLSWKIGKNMNLKKIGLSILLMMAPWTLMAETICAIVKIEIRQELSLERQAFDAKMVITNGLDVVSLENLDINVVFEDAEGNPVLASSDPDNTSASFFITVDRMEGVNSIDGSGIINAGEAATIHWLIIPAPGAGGQTPVGLGYAVGATVSYTFGEETQVVNVVPDFIQVRPTPLLTLDYFIPQDVFGDDPLTQQTEDIEPFDLGLRIKNSGFGDAINLKIESAQPEIIENEQGLLIDFALLGSSVNDSEVSNSLLADIGLLPGGESAMVSWLMSTSLNGEFISFTADFVHSDEFGGALTSLIDSVNTHYLAHKVLVDFSGRDQISDFLAIDGDQYRVYESNGGQADVIEAAGNLADGGVISGQQRYTLTFNPNSGPVYTQVNDPYQGQHQQLTALRSDGKVLPEQNVWQFKIETNPGEYEYYIGLFDVSSTGQYEIVVNGTEPNVAPVITVNTPQAAEVGTLLEFDVDVTDANVGDVLSLVLLSAPDEASVSFVAGSTWRFAWVPDNAGSQVVVLRASDGQLNTDATVTIEISEGNQDDSDLDGMNDDWERLYFGDLDETAEGDFDQDSASNLQEHDFGGDPTVEDRPSPVTILNPSNGSFSSSSSDEFTVVNAVAAANADVVYEFELYETNLSATPLAQATIDETAVQTAWQHEFELNENTSYIWRVRPFDGATPGLWAYDSFTYSVTDEPAYGCAIDFPDNQTVTTEQPSLSIIAASDDDSDALSYRFKIFTDQLMSDQIVDSGWLSAATISTNQDYLKQWQTYASFEDSVTYYWQASVKDNNAEVDCGDAAFTVDTTLTLPHGYALDSELLDVVTGSDIELIVQHDDSVAAAGDYLYDIQIDKNLDFTSAALQTITDQTADSNQQVKWQVTGLDDDSVYYWRAKARFNGLSGAWVYGRIHVQTDTTSVSLSLMNPSHLSWVDNLRPVLSFQADTGFKTVANYRVEVFSDDAATQLVHETVTVNTEIILPELTDRDYYYWRVTPNYADSSLGVTSGLSRFYTIDSDVIEIPSFEFISLQQAEENQGLEYTIQWTDAYDGGDASIDLYYDSNGQGEDGVLIVAGLSEDDLMDSFVWNFSGLDEGDYHLYAVIDANGLTDTVYTLNPLTLSYSEVSQQIDTMTTSESGDAATVTVALNKTPTDYVRVKAQVSDAAEAEVMPAELIFTPSNWHTPQDLVVQGIDDGVFDGDVNYQLVFDGVDSADQSYHGLTLETIQMVNIGDGVFTPMVDVSLVKNLITPAPFQVGDQIQYELIISNQGPNDATDIVVSDTMTNLTLLSTSGTSCLPANSFPCTISDLAVGQSVTINVSTELTAAGAFDNEATALAAEQDVDTNNNTDNIDNGGVSVGPNLAVSIDVCEQNIQSIQSVVYQLEVKNTGDLAINGATLSSNSSNQIIVQSWECNGIDGATCAAATGSGNIDESVDLPVDSSLIYLMLADINGQIGDVITQSATINMPNGINDVSPGDNSASQINTINDVIFDSGFEPLVNLCQ